MAKSQATKSAQNQVVQNDNQPAQDDQQVVATAAPQRTRCKVYTRVVGFIRPVDNWNDSKTCEYQHRKVFSEKVSQNSSQQLAN